MESESLRILLTEGFKFFNHDFKVEQIYQFKPKALKYLLTYGLPALRDEKFTIKKISQIDPEFFNLFLTFHYGILALEQNLFKIAQISWIDVSQLENFCAKFLIFPLEEKEFDEIFN